MGFEVILTEDAERDLEEIYDHISASDSRHNADCVLDRLLETAQTLTERGVPPKELRSLGLQEYRQLSFKPYHIIYRVIDHRVIIYVIADGRRDMQTLLSRRLLGG